MESEVEKVNEGKRSIKTIFKSTDEKKNYSINIQKQIEILKDKIA